MFAHRVRALWSRISATPPRHMRKTVQTMDGAVFVAGKSKECINSSCTHFGKHYYATGVLKCRFRWIAKSPREFRKTSRPKFGTAARYHPPFLAIPYSSRDAELVAVEAQIRAAIRDCVNRTSRKPLCLTQDKIQHNLP
jgi:hypothetical protein